MEVKLNITHIIGLFVLLLLSSTQSVKAAAIDLQTMPQLSLHDKDMLKPKSVNEEKLSCDTTSKRGSIFKQLAHYLETSDDEAPKGKFDFGILGGPHYSSTDGFGLGLVASGLYSMDSSDSTLQRSNLSIYADFSSCGLFEIGIEGNNFFAKNKYRLEYNLFTYTFPSKFWGFGFESGNKDENKSKFRKNLVSLDSRFMFNVSKNHFIGPMLRYHFIGATNLDSLARVHFDNQRRNVNVISLGFSYVYDSRDFMLNASRGIFFRFNQSFSPKFIGNRSFFATSDILTSSYNKLWKGAILASEIHGQINAGRKVPWTVLAEVGNSHRMRGYYEGRYRDRNLIEGQIELRQHIWHRNGIVAWLGFANIANKLKKFRMDHTLPNYGLGYRWAFKKGINIRVDYGFTKNGSGVVFNVNEAF